MNPVLIYVRFSMVNKTIENSWKASRILNDHQKYCDAMFAPERINTRARLFLDYALPMIAKGAELNPDLAIRVLLHTSPLLPEPIKLRLIEAQRQYPCLRVDYFDYEAEYDTRAIIISELAELCADHSITEDVIVPSMRLDDDDMMSPHYFQVMKKYMKPHFVGMTMHTNRGYEGLFYDDAFHNFSDMDSPRTGIGLAHITMFSPEKKKFITRNILPPGRHSETDKFAPVILDGSEPLIFRTRHNSNDTGIKGDGTGHYSEDIEVVRKRFFRVPSDNAILLQYFPILEKDIKALTPQDMTKGNVA